MVNFFCLGADDYAQADWVLVLRASCYVLSYHAFHDDSGVFSLLLRYYQCASHRESF